MIDSGNEGDFVIRDPEAMRAPHRDYRLQYAILQGMRPDCNPKCLFGKAYKDSKCIGR